MYKFNIPIINTFEFWKSLGVEYDQTNPAYVDEKCFGGLDQHIKLSQKVTFKVLTVQIDPKYSRK